MGNLMGKEMGNRLGNTDKKGAACMVPNGKVVLMATGASGGHIMPAISVAEELRRRGYTCVFVVGGSKFAGLVTDRGFALERLPASAVANRGLLGKMKAAVLLLRGFLRAGKLVRQYKPVAAFGTGGYASVAMLLACKVLGVPTVLHEANVILGMANKFLAPRVSRVLLSFEESVKRLPQGSAPAVVVGTPLREEVLKARNLPRKESKLFRLLVIGGSQGSSVLGEMVVDAVKQLPEKLRKTLRVVQQARPDDVAKVKAAYAGMKIEAEVDAFFGDVPLKLRQCDLFVGRSGVGMLLEAATLGRAAIYTPHRLADNHQLYNAQVAEKAGAARIVEEPEGAERLAEVMAALMKDAKAVAKMEAAAVKLARPDSAMRCADEIVSLIK